MVICFEEKDRAVIEDKGMMIIEFKQQIHRMKKAVDRGLSIMKEYINIFAKTWNAFVEKFLEAVDGVKLVFEQIREVYNYPTSDRYRTVKMFSKCTGTNIRFWWNFTFKVRRWLARSCC